jgi:hypothetical protein
MSLETKKINSIKVKPLNQKIIRPRTIPTPFPDPVSGDSEPFVWVYCAKIGSGKSVNLSNLLITYKNYFRKVYFCSSNIQTNEESGLKEIKDLAYQNQFRFSQERLFDDFNDSIMKDIIDDIKLCKKESDYDENEDHFLIVVDDLSQSFLNVKSLITKTILKTRHMKLSWIITTQRYRNINPAIRGQISYFVCFNTQNKKEIEAMAETVDMTENNFDKILTFATMDDYSFLFVDSSKNPAKFYKTYSEEIISSS